MEVVIICYVAYMDYHVLYSVREHQVLISICGKYNCADVLLLLQNTINCLRFLIHHLPLPRDRAPGLMIQTLRLPSM